MNKETKDFQLSIEEVRQRYQLENFETGLTSEEAGKRLVENGLNQLKVTKMPKWRLFLRQFNNMIIYILIGSAVLTLVMGHFSDAVIIALVVIVNALIGYFQEANASDALERIKELLASEATVYRDGTRQDILTENLVVGDVVFLEAGDSLPADLRIVDEDNLRIQESALTGETDSVEKNVIEIFDPETPLGNRFNMAYASTTVTNGSGLGVVVATGQETEIGKISTEVTQVKERKTPLMQEIDRLGKGITYVIMGGALALFGISLFLDTYALSVLSLAVVTMIVGSIPEGLPATTSVVLAMGVNDMAKNKHTIIKTLPAVETLGSVDVVATDKTGTLTKNEMTVKDLWIGDQFYEVSGNGYEPEGQILDKNQPVEMNQKLALFLEAGFEANDTVLVEENNRWSINGEPADGSFLTLYHKGFTKERSSEYQEIDFLPFDSDYRYMAKLVDDSYGNRKVFIKGSPDKIFPMAQALDPAFPLSKWSSRVQALSELGKRVVAVGYQEVSKETEEITHELLNQGIHLIGLAGIIDPPREEVIETLKEMRMAGVEVKMITGDHPLTAKTIAERLGLAEDIKVITGAELDELTSDQLAQVVLSHQVFARTTPKNKLEIVAALQANGKVTAMTGDGVNDAPALKQADIGIAMGIKGTDVAKESADMILTNDHFATISIAIKEGRKIYDNIKKSILFLLPTSFAEGLIIAFTILMQQQMPLQPTQLLWINMVSAITIQFAFIFEPAEANSMNRPPRKTGQSLLSRHDIVQMAYVSVIIAVISLGAYEWLLGRGVAQTIASTMMVNLIVLSKIFYLFSIRTKQRAFSKEFFSNPKAFWIIGLMLILQVILTYVPFMQTAFNTQSLSLLEWGVALIAGAVVLVVAELDKAWRNRKRLV